MKVSMVQAPAKANSAIGVKVVGGPKGCIYVKVHCADRRGLLADIIAALKSMPLEVQKFIFLPFCLKRATLHLYLHLQQHLIVWLIRATVTWQA